MDDAPPNVPTCSIAPPPRCHYRDELHPGYVCGELATCVRPGRDWFNPEYFCDRHKQPADVPIPAEHVFRRVVLEVKVLFAGTHINAPIAQAEAVARLERAVVAIGGLVEVEGARSYVVKSPAQTPPRRAFGPSPRG